MKPNWNNGIDYGFSLIRLMMWILGLWPLQRSNVFYTIQWFIIFIVVSFTLINVLIESLISCDVNRDGLEILRVLEACTISWLNVFFSRIYMRKIAINISSAIDDWASLAIKKESRVVMMAYARIGRLITIIHLTVGIGGSILYFILAFLENEQKAATQINGTETAWTFVFPATCLYKGVSYSTYKKLFALQIIQTFFTISSESGCDNFFLSITMHLCSQLELLKVQFTEISKKCHEKKRQGNLLEPLIRRHCHLIALSKNIEDAFNINILIRLLVISIVIAASGIGFLVSIKQQDYVEVIKMIIMIQFLMIQAFSYAYAGDMLQNQSESIVSAIYSSELHEMSSIMVKDLIFIMMRTQTPLQISAGKFFYLTRNTMIDIIKTTFTYISFIRITMDKEFTQ